VGSSSSDRRSGQLAAAAGKASGHGGPDRGPAAVKRPGHEEASAVSTPGHGQRLPSEDLPPPPSPATLMMATSPANQQVPFVRRVQPVSHLFHQSRRGL